jgi:hypothetical protein
LNAPAAITGASRVAFVTAAAISHGGHREQPRPPARGRRGSRRDRHQRIGQRRPGRLQRHRVRAYRRSHLREHLPDLPGPPARPAQPAPHRVLGNFQLCRDPAVSLSPGRRGQRRPDHRRLIHPPQQQPRGQQHVRHPARRAPGPARPHHPACPPPRPEDLPLPAMPPPRQPSPAARAGQTALFQHPLDAPGVVAYREHRCSFAPARGPPRGLAKRSRGGPPRNRHAHGVVAQHTPQQEHGQTSPLTLNDADQPRHAHG